MFTTPSTPRLSTLCLVAQNARVAKERHPSFDRLMQFAMSETLGIFGVAPSDESAVRQVMGVSSGTFTNWKSRGLSRDAALTAQRKLGCSATWLLTGVGEHAAPQDATAAEPHAAYDAAPVITESQLQMLEDFKLLPDDEKQALRATLREKADKMRKIYDEWSHRRNVPAPTSNRRVEETFGPSPTKGKKK